jgi:outer membrane protein assembly factor BamB
MTIVTLTDWSANAQVSNMNKWPSFRGINCSGLAAPDQDPPVIFGPAQNVLWKTSLPSGHSSPCIWGDFIFITGSEKKGNLLKIFCINRNDGTIRWKDDISVKEFEGVHYASNPATATPSTDGERVYFYFSSYGLLCYDYNGKVQWKLPIPVPKSRHGMGTSPIVTGNLVILNCFGDLNDPRLLAINKYDGSTIWKYSLPKPEPNANIRDSYSTPVIYKDQVIIYASDDVAGYNIKTGDRIWRFVIDVVDAVCTPVVGNDILYAVSYAAMGNPTLRDQFSGFKEFTAKYDENKDLMIDKKEIKYFYFLINPEMPEIPGYDVPMQYVFGWWDKNNDEFIDSTEFKNLNEWWESLYEKQGLKAIKLGGEGDIGINYYLWGHTDDVPYVSSPLLVNNHVYMISNGGIISCFHAESGKLLYKERVGASGAYFSSPIAANGRVYIASRNGIVIVLEAGDKLKILAKNDLGDIITATPAVVDNKLYLHTAGSLYAFGK